VEFNAPDSDNIPSDSSCRPNPRKLDASAYNLDRVLHAGRRHFSRVEARASLPASRTILVFD
jgi:hypothetical protein